MKILEMFKAFNIKNKLKDIGIPQVDIKRGNDLKAACVKKGLVSSGKEWERLKQQNALTFRVSEEGVRILFIGGMKKPIIINYI